MTVVLISNASIFSSIMLVCMFYAQICFCNLKCLVSADIRV